MCDWHILVTGKTEAAHGAGAILSNSMEDGQGRPVAFASRSLAPAECNRPQLDKKVLAIILGVKKFHDYLFGQ